MGQVAHRSEARHARAALERVQRTLERRQTIDAAAILVPLCQRTLRRVDELDGFVGEDAGDVLVEVGHNVFDHVCQLSYDSGGKDAGGAATAGAAGAGDGRRRRRMSRRDLSATRAAATMRCSSCSVAVSMRASSPPCDWKKPVDSSRCAATAAWHSCSRRAGRDPRRRVRRRCRKTCAPSVRAAR